MFFSHCLTRIILDVKHVVLRQARQLFLDRIARTIYVDVVYCWIVGSDWPKES